MLFIHAASNNYECCARQERASLHPKEPKMGESNRQEKSSGHGYSPPIKFQVDAETEIDHKPGEKLLTLQINVGETSLEFGTHVFQVLFSYT